MKKLMFLASIAVAMLCATVHAAPIAILASDNATVQVAGPRSGNSGKNFFNMEGSNNGNFASFGVADFTFAAAPNVTSVGNVSLKLTQSNAGFSHDGPLSFYLTGNTASNIIQPGDASAVKYQGSADGAASVDPALSPLTSVGSGVYTVIANDTVDMFSLSPAIESALLSVVQNGGTLRLVITPDDPATAATYAGAANLTVAGPTLVFDAEIPEPASAALIGVAFLAALVARRNSIL